jgi:adenosylcobinamide-GDP ribazoletransferase
MLSPAWSALALITAHGAARAFPTIVMASLPYAGDPEAAKLKPAATSVRPGEAIVAALLGVALVVLLIPPIQAAFGLALAACGALLLALTARRLIGGFTGDLLGAVEQVAELGLLLGFAAKGLGL